MEISDSLLLSARTFRRDAMRGIGRRDHETAEILLMGVFVIDELFKLIDEEEGNGDD